MAYRRGVKRYKDGRSAHPAVALVEDAAVLMGAGELLQRGIKRAGAELYHKAKKALLGEDQVVPQFVEDEGEEWRGEGGGMAEDLLASDIKAPKKGMSSKAQRNPMAYRRFSSRRSYRSRRPGYGRRVRRRIMRGRRRKYRARRVGMRRMIRDTRMRSELKDIKVLQGDHQILTVPEQNTAPSFLELTDGDMPQGTANGERVGNAIQIRSLEFRALLRSAEQDVYIRWALFKSKNNSPADYLKPTALLYGAAGGGAVQIGDWNNPWMGRRDDRPQTNFWADSLKLIRSGMITMPSTKTVTNVRMKILFSPGKRPIESWKNSTTGVCDKNRYFLMFWANEANDAQTSALTTGAYLANIYKCVTYYDA